MAARINREELRKHVLLAFERHGISVKLLEIIPLGADGGWRIGSTIIASPEHPAVYDVAEQIETELGAIYSLKTARN